MNYLMSILSGVWGISEVILGLRTRSARHTRRGGRRGSLTLLWIVIGASLIAANLSRLLGIWRFPGRFSFYVLVGSGILIVGVVIRWSAILALGRFFSVDVAMQKEHRIIRSGLYRWIRHPAYTGLLLCFLGVGIAFGNWLSLLLVMVPITAVLIVRIRSEEAALVEEFGAEYAEYKRQTRKLVPGVY